MCEFDQKDCLLLVKKMKGNSSPLSSADEICAWSDFVVGESMICTSSVGGDGALLRPFSTSLQTALEFFVKLRFQPLYGVYLSVEF
jgi:hypothetical protein